MRTQLLRFIREVQYWTPLRRYFFPHYQFMFTAPQLCFLCQCVEQTRAVEGDIAEIGCARGATTIFLNKYMDARAIEKSYYAVDTFRGFLAKDTRYEMRVRGKKERYFTAFRVNKKKWFDGTMRLNGITRVRSIQADVNAYDLTALGPIAFALRDVDLYRPTRNALPQLYSALAPGGILVVDDCNPCHRRWDGAAQAYEEFVLEKGVDKEIVFDKLGVLRKPA